VDAEEEEDNDDDDDNDDYVAVYLNTELDATQTTKRMEEQISILVSATWRADSVADAAVSERHAAACLSLTPVTVVVTATTAIVVTGRTNAYTTESRYSTRA
jgi:hypothetical protein